MQVIVVASQGGQETDWAAYIGAVKGDDHATEWQEVLKHGTKLRKDIAEVIFPWWAKNYTWRE